MEGRHNIVVWQSASLVTHARITKSSSVYDPEQHQWYRRRSDVHEPSTGGTQRLGIFRQGL